MHEAKGKENCVKQTMRQTSGTKSNARIRQETVKKNGVEPSRMQMFYHIHARKDGTPVEATSTDKIYQMQGRVNDLPEDCKDSMVEESIFSKFMGPDGHSRVKMTGLGAKPATMWGPRSTCLQLEREVAEARKVAVEARRDAAEARRVAHDGLTAFASIISQHLGGMPIDIDAILRGISTQGPPDGNHSAPASSGYVREITLKIKELYNHRSLLDSLKKPFKEIGIILLLFCLSLKEVQRMKANKEKVDKKILLTKRFNGPSSELKPRGASSTSSHNQNRLQMVIMMKFMYVHHPHTLIRITKLGYVWSDE